MFTDEQLHALYTDFCSSDKDAKVNAISLIYIKYRPIFFKRMRYKFRSLSETEIQDIVQDAFLKIYTTSSQPSSPYAMRSWVLTIAEKTAIDLFRRAYKRNEIDWPESFESDDDKVEKRSVTNSVGLIKPGDESLNRDVEQCVSDGINNFAEIYPDREAVISLSLDGYPVQEIADLFHRTEQAMRQFIYESKKKLAPFIERCVEDLA